MGGCKIIYFCTDSKQQIQQNGCICGIDINLYKQFHWTREYFAKSLLKGVSGYEHSIVLIKGYANATALTKTFINTWTVMLFVGFYYTNLSKGVTEYDHSNAYLVDFSKPTSQ